MQSPILASGGPLSKYKPKAMSIKQVYGKLNDKRGDLERHDHMKAKDALQEANYSRTEIANLLDRHFEVRAKEMHKIAGHLREAGVAGFRDVTPREAVNKFVRGEMVKGRSINVIKKEHQREMMEEGMPKKEPKISMSSLERMTKAAKPGKPKLVK